MSEPLQIEVSWPAKQLSPNHGCHHMTRHRFKKAAKREAGWATKFALQNNRGWEPAEEKLSIHLIAHPPMGWRTGDEDNLVARAKSHLDGIAKALGINDRYFKAPTVTWAERSDPAKLIVEIS